jgi:hypothetical protein
MHGPATVCRVERAVEVYWGGADFINMSDLDLKTSQMGHFFTLAKFCFKLKTKIFAKISAF